MGFRLLQEYDLREGGFGFPSSIDLLEIFAVGAGLTARANRRELVSMDDLDGGSTGVFPELQMAYEPAVHLLGGISLSDWFDSYCRCKCRQEAGGGSSDLRSE